jgi:hypothetical protein
MRQCSKQVMRIAKIVARKFMDNAKLVAMTVDVRIDLDQKHASNHFVFSFSAV